MLLNVYILMILSKGEKVLQIISSTSIYDCLGNHKLKFSTMLHRNNTAHTIPLDSSLLIVNVD
jgi:hypothetical protein